jgi:SH3 domain-containing YSC84-like protein 1
MTEPRGGLVRTDEAASFSPDHAQAYHDYGDAAAEASSSSGPFPSDRTNAVATVSSPWQYDDSALYCSSCHSQFNWINRRHHCRLCGKVFCHNCTSHKSLIPPSQIVLTPAGFQGNKPSSNMMNDETGAAASFSPQEDPDRMLTYLAPSAAAVSLSSSSSSSAEQPVDPIIAQERTILYGRGLEERMHLAREPLRVCGPCHQRLLPLQEQLIAANSNMMRYNPFDPHDFRRLFNSPLAFTLGHEIRKAAHTLHNLLPLPKRLGAMTAAYDNESTMMFAPKEPVPCQNLQQETCGGGANGGGGPIQPNLANIDGVRIPAKLLEMAKGIAVLTILKGGIGFAGMEIGTGLVIARTHEYNGDATGWSPPSAIGTVGISWGALIGALVTDHVFLLMDDNAVGIMFGQSSITLGVDVGIAVGPVGRSAEADFNFTAGRPAAGIYTYSLSKGLYAGISLDGKIVVTRNDVNEKFYGRRISGQEILRGRGVPTPPAARPLYEALERCHVYASGHPSQHPHFRRQQQQQHLQQQQQQSEFNPYLPGNSTSMFPGSSPYSLQGRLAPAPPARGLAAVDPVMGEYGETSATGDEYDGTGDSYDPSLMYRSRGGGSSVATATPPRPTSNTGYGTLAGAGTVPHTSASSSPPPSTTTPEFRAAPTIVSLPPPPSTTST